MLEQPIATTIGPTVTLAPLFGFTPLPSRMTSFVTPIFLLSCCWLLLTKLAPRMQDILLRQKTEVSALVQSHRSHIDIRRRSIVSYRLHRHPKLCPLLQLYGT